MEEYKESALSARKHKRFKTLMDILTTERSYVKSLDILNDVYNISVSRYLMVFFLPPPKVYMNPLKEESRKPNPLITSDQINKIFLNLPVIRVFFRIINDKLTVNKGCE